MRRAGAALAVVLLLAGAFVVGLVLTRAPEQTLAPLARGPAVPDIGKPEAWHPVVDRLREEVRQELQNDYYRPVEADVLARETVPEMLEALGDPYTEYLTPEEYDSLQNRTARSYSGVGLTVGPVGEGLIVTSALLGPAREAGIRKGDVIVSIDGKPTSNLPFERSVTLIKGDQGTIVHLAVLRAGDSGTMHFTVVRQDIPTPAIRSRLIRVAGTPLGYVRLFGFPGSATGRVEQATESLVERGAQGLILDLRDNPGGLLAQAVQAVSLFLPEGVVCTVQGVHHPPQVFDAAGGARYPTLPLVVLMNGGTASAAEIVAAALGDNGRAVLVGERTYGKASVQSVHQLSNGGALKLTTARYRTPAGLDITGLGVGPDVLAADDPLTRPDEAVVTAEHELLEQIG